MPFKDATKFFDEAVIIKDCFEVDQLKAAARFTVYLMNQVISEVEEDIERNAGERHDVIGKKMDLLLEKKNKIDAFVSKLPQTMKSKFDESCIELGSPVLI